MRCFFDPHQLDHAPAEEYFNGALTPHADKVARAQMIVAALGSVEPPADFGMAPIAAVHDAAYLDFLAGAHGAWRAAGRAGDAVGYAWPVGRFRPGGLRRVDALLGLHSMDAVTPIGAATWRAAYGGAQAALAAADTVRRGDRAAFALCRPPGHHAGAAYLGGYCYLNNAAIAAQAMLAGGAPRVAILDVDYHHGNGTQDIFYDRGDALFVSIHADPATDFPYFWGRPEESGKGEGAGANLNIVLPRGTGWTDYRPALYRALDRIAAFGPAMLVVSFGADTFAGDPIAGFRLDTGDYPSMAADIAALGVPVAVVMEGGYAVDALGANVAAFLAGF